MKNNFLLGFALFSLSFPLFAQEPEINVNGAAIEAEIVQSRFIFDVSNVENASLVENNNQYQGLHLELKPLAASELTNMTNAGLGKKINIMINGKLVTTNVIKTALGSHLVITGIPKEQAQHFIQALRYSHEEMNKKESLAMGDKIKQQINRAADAVPVIEDKPAEMAMAMNNNPAPAQEVDPGLPTVAMASKAPEQPEAEFNESDFTAVD